MDIKAILDGAKTVGISGHVKPDGDCVGSSLALYHYIKNNYKDIDVTLYLEEIADRFTFLSLSEEINHNPNEDKHFDVYFALDCGDSLRLGDFASYFEKATKKVCIDHHKSNTSFADYNYIFGDASSTSELIFDLIGRESITKEIAECLYLGMVHDTGIFKYSCTHRSTMEAAGYLMEKGIDYARIVDETFYEITYKQNRILGKVVMDSKLYHNDEIIVGYVTLDTAHEYNVSKGDYEAIVDQLRITKGVEIAVFIYENEDNTYKVSMRSKRRADVSKVAVKLNGGGHERAAGATVSGNLDSIIDMLIEELSKELD